MDLKDPLLNWWWLSVGAAAVMIAIIALVRRWRRRVRHAAMSRTVLDDLGFTITVIDGRAFGESGFRAAITLLSIAEQQAGIPAAAIVGSWRLDDDEVKRLRSSRPNSLRGEFLNNPQGFIENSAFSELLHHVIAAHPPGTDAIAATVGAGGNGEIFMADNRNSRAIGEADLEDFFGSFHVENGSIVSYERNGRHRLFTRMGLFRLPRPMHEALLRELRAPSLR